MFTQPKIVTMGKLFNKYKAQKRFKIESKIRISFTEREIKLDPSVGFFHSDTLIDLIDSNKKDICELIKIKSNFDITMIIKQIFKIEKVLLFRGDMFVEEMTTNFTNLNGETVW